MKRKTLSLFGLLLVLIESPTATLGETVIDAMEARWTTYSPRDEMRPRFDYFPGGGRAGNEALVINAVGRVGIDGAWITTIPVKPKTVYRFSAKRRTEGIDAPFRSAIAKITWMDEDGKMVLRASEKPQPEYPMDQSVGDDGWTTLSDQYLVPENATQAKIELHLRWTEKGSVRWSQVTLSPSNEAIGREVRLAAVHFRPRGGTTAIEKCRLFAPLIEKAAEKGADLVCLPESLTYYSSGKSLAEVAESIPGPSTQYFGKLAKKHQLYIVAGLTERADATVYNTAALIGPDGELIGSYRKVCLPREEIEAGVTPGNDYPVFETRFGKLGMMICWDVHFPEVARNLTINGAEVIAMPIWGGNPTLASARSIENQIYLVSSTYTDPAADAMVSGIWDHKGHLLQKGETWGTVVVAAVDLDRRTQWQWLGDFKARIHRERPASGFGD